MAVQQNKVSRSRRNKRRSHHALQVPNTHVCSACGEKKLPHHVCPSCGDYRGHQIVDMTVEEYEDDGT